MECERQLAVSKGQRIKQQCKMKTQFSKEKMLLKIVSAPEGAPFGGPSFGNK